MSHQKEIIFITMIPSFNFHGSFRHQPVESKSKGKTHGDRTISLTLGQHQQFNFQSNTSSRQQSPYQQLLLQQMQSGARARSGSQRSAEKVLLFKNTPVSQKEEMKTLISMPNTPLVNLGSVPEQMLNRRRVNINQLPQNNQFPSEPIVSLDAPDVEDNFYTTPIDWSLSNYIALASGSNLFAYNYTRKQVIQFNTDPNRKMMCVRWNRQLPVMLASGNTMGEVNLWDIENQQRINSIRISRSNRTVNCLSVADNTVACGCSNSMLCIYDPRLSSSVAQLTGHTESILGVRFQSDGFSSGPYLASSGADRQVLIWDLRKRDTMVNKLMGHTGFAKALDWSPFKQHVLCTGGGEGDKSIRTWLASTGEPLSCIKTESQITSVVYSDPDAQLHELYTAHGYSDNALRIWNLSGDIKLDYELLHHKKRILGLALNPGGKLLCTLGGDELMKIWNLSAPALARENSQKKRFVGADEYR